MRSLSLFVAASVLSAAAFLAVVPGDETLASPTSRNADVSGATQSADGRFVVHEWGTFTSFSGSDGVKLEFRPLVDEDLPHFVVDRAEQSGQVSPFIKWSYRAYQRMETPVLYFYTDRERDVNVRVDFPQGLITEFYPPVQEMLPKFDYAQAQRGEPLAQSAVDWGTVRLIPAEHLQTQVQDPALADCVHQHLLRSLIPQATENHYAFARETDAAIVHVHRAPAAANPAAVDLELRMQAPTGDFFEHFLFYRGLGNFTLPLHLAALMDGTFRLANSGPEPVHSLFLVTNDPDGLRWSHTGGIGPKQTLTLTQSPEAGSLADLREAVVTSLIAEGLYEKEARAMVKTWESSWFGEAGTRLFYIVPQRITAQLLPLRLDPQPQELVRVLVGRMEIMAPSAERQILDLVERSRAARAVAAEREAGDAERLTMLKPTFDELLLLGRLAEPALLRVRHIAPEIALRYEAAALLSELRSHYQALAEQQQTAAIGAGG
jgi:hypothetical protein